MQVLFKKKFGKLLIKFKNAPAYLRIGNHAKLGNLLGHRNAFNNFSRHVLCSEKMIV